MRIAVLGGGIAGLSVAHYVGRQGHETTVFEATDRYGPLCGSFAHGLWEFDRIPHALASSDTALCGLLSELRLSDRLVWRPGHRALAKDQRLFTLDSIGDVRRLRALSTFARWRAFLGLLFAARMPGSALHLDDVPAPAWLAKQFGTRAYGELLEPMLLSQHGAYLDEIPAYLLFSHIARLQQKTTPMRGFLRGGLRRLGESLGESIGKHGGRVFLNTEVDRVEWEAGRVFVEAGEISESFDSLISTIPLPSLAKIAAEGLLRELPSLELPYQGEVWIAVVLHRPVTRAHQTLIGDQPAAFWLVENLSALMPESDSGGRQLLYLKRSVPAHHEGYRASDASIEAQALDLLGRVFPLFSRADVEATCVTRRPLAEPLFELGSRSRRIPVRLESAKVLLCVGPQAYPRQPGADSSVILARQTAQRVETH